jgi:hypothetical protein
MAADRIMARGLALSCVVVVCVCVYVYVSVGWLVGGGVVLCLGFRLFD